MKTRSWEKPSTSSVIDRLSPTKGIFRVLLSERHPKLLSAAGRREIWLSLQQFSWCAAFRGTTEEALLPFSWEVSRGGWAELMPLVVVFKDSRGRCWSFLKANMPWFQPDVAWTSTHSLTLISLYLFEGGWTSEAPWSKVHAGPWILCRSDFLQILKIASYTDVQNKASLSCCTFLLHC